MEARFIKDLVKDMEQSTLIIPSFQRDYVWGRDQIEALFDSFMRGLPISSLLFWKLDSEQINKINFKFYKFYSNYESERKNNEPATPHNGTYYAVIDGQQRLTSLYIGFFGSYRVKKKYSRDPQNYVVYTLYLRLTTATSNTVDSPEENKYGFKFLSENDLKKMIREEHIVDGVPTIITDKENAHWIKVSDIPKYNDEDYITDLQVEYSLNTVELKTLRRLYNFYHNIGQIACIDWKGDVEEAISVFVRYNSKGTELTPGQVMMSIMTESWPDVRETFKELRAQVSKLGFDKARVEYIVKALLTVYTDSPKNNINAINQARVNKFRQEWKHFSATVIRMFTMLKDEGFNHRTLTSYNATLPILYYLLNKKKNNNLSYDNRKISTWLIGTLLTGAFSGQSDSAISNALKPLREMVDNGKEIEKFPADEISEALKSDIRDIDVADVLNIQKEDVKAPLIMSLLFPDCWNLASELDHIHPISSFDKKNKEEYEEANSIVNLQPLNGVINVTKLNSPFEEWMQKQFDTSDERDKYLKSIGIKDDRSEIKEDVCLSFDDRHKMWAQRRIILEKRLHEILKK